MALYRDQVVVACYLSVKAAALPMLHLPSMCAASNYRQGRAEASIGRALSLLLLGNTASEFPESRLEVTRDALFISSKAGYLTPGETQDHAAHGTAGSCSRFCTPLAVVDFSLSVDSHSSSQHNFNFHKLARDMQQPARLPISLSLSSYPRFPCLLHCRAEKAVAVAPPGQHVRHPGRHTLPGPRLHPRLAGVLAGEAAGGNLGPAVPAQPCRGAT